MKNKGFTLIELLVVVAIIGILASVVLASLNSARGKANDVKIKSQLKNIVTAAALYYATNGNYGGSTQNNTCSGTGVLWGDTSSGLQNLTNPSNYPYGITCWHNAQDLWVVFAKLSDNSYWCVDSEGRLQSLAGSPTQYRCVYP